MDQVLEIQHKDLSASLKAELLAMLSRAYEEDFSYELSLLSEAVHFLGYQGERLVTHAAYVPRRIAIDGVDLNAAYVEAVATDLDVQRQGLGRQIMVHMAGKMADRFELGVLSPSEVDFYASFGWELWQGRKVHIEAGQAHEMPEEEVMILKLPSGPKHIDLTGVIETDWREGDIW